MNSKERVLDAVSHKETDRIPADYWATEEVTESLIEYFGLKDYDSLLEKLQIDMRYIFPPYIGPELKTFPDGSKEDIWKIRRDPVYNEVCYAPLSGASTVEDLDKYTWPSPDWYDYSKIPEMCEKYNNYAIVVCDERTNRTTVLHAGIYLCGMEKVMTDFYINPELVNEMFKRVSEFYLEVNRRIFEAAKGKIDIILIGDDFGTQEALLLSPKMLNDFIYPYLKKYFDLAHQYNVKVMFHSCGAIREIIPDLIDLGVDILNPIQVRAKGMVPEELKERFGKQLCFHGGIDVQKTLPFGSTEDVKKEVEDRIRVLGAGGGYILAPTHNFQPGTPVENIITMYETALGIKILK